MSGAMYDIRNDYLYLTVEAEGLGSTTRPYAWIEDANAVKEARDKAAKSFTSELSKRMMNLK